MSKKCITACLSVDNPWFAHPHQSIYEHSLMIFDYLRNILPNYEPVMLIEIQGYVTKRTAVIINRVIIL